MPGLNRSGLSPARIWATRLSNSGVTEREPLDDVALGATRSGVRDVDVRDVAVRDASVGMGQELVDRVVLVLDNGDRQVRVVGRAAPSRRAITRARAP